MTIQRAMGNLSNGFARYIWCIHRIALILQGTTHITAFCVSDIIIICDSKSIKNHNLYLYAMCAV